MTRKMKDSGVEWIGSVPEEWSVKTLKRAFSNRAGGAWGEESKGNENDRVCIRIADFDYSKLKIKDNIEFTKRNYNEDTIMKLELKQGDILVEKSGGGETTPVGRTILYDLPIKALYANFMDRLRVYKDNSPKFIEYVLVTFYQQGITKQYIKQTTGIQNLDLTSMLSEEQIVIPKKEVQELIANYLDKKCTKIDDTIEKEKQLIEKLKEYKQSVITEAVTKGLNPNAKMKDSGVEWIGEIPENWRIQRLKHIFAFKKGLSITKDNLVEKGIKVISYGQIHSKSNVGVSIDDSLIRYVGEEYLETGKQSLVNKNDFIFADTSEDLEGAGNYVYIGENQEIFAGYHTIILAPIKQEIMSEWKYFAYLYKTDCWRSQIRSRVSGIKLFSITQKILKQTDVIIPDIKEQKEIADYLDKKCSSIDKLIADKEELIQKLTEYKKSLIYECVTGKREV